MECACVFAEAEHLFLCKKQKTKHLLQADKGSKYFHDLIRMNHHDGAINFILGHNGEPTTSIDQVGTLFVNHFQQMFGEGTVGAVSKLFSLTDRESIRGILPLL
nr:Protein CUP-SHAPED COTYLEDON 2 isoform B [Ipomoea batatas]